MSISVWPDNSTPFRGAPAARHRPALDDVDVAALARHRLAVLDIAIEDHRVAELAQQAHLEAPQRGRLLGARAERGERFLVDREQLLVRIVARQQLQQQLVEVESRRSAPGP